MFPILNGLIQIANMSQYMPVKNSRLKDFRNQDIDSRVRIISELAGLSEEETKQMINNGSLSMDISSRLIENAFMNIEIPVGIATNFTINGKDYLIPMAVEEPSVVAACSNAARMAREKGGFTSVTSQQVMFGQIQVTGVSDREKRVSLLMTRENEILNLANTVSNTLRNSGRGAKKLIYKKPDWDTTSIIIQMEVDVGDAMGANVINSMAEKVAPLIEEITGGEVILRILSNLTPLRIARSHAIFPASSLGGEIMVDRFIKAAKFAENDVYRAVTHNKGIMNGIDAVLLATMNDWRQAEANAHAYASLSGVYKSLTTYSKTEEGDLSGSIEIPLAVGTVGGTTSSIPKAKICMKILGVRDAPEFQCVLASVGLAQNFAAVRALSNEGIQKGHMSLHSRSVSISAGALPDEVDRVSEQMIRDKTISVTYARELLEKMRKEVK